MNLPKAELDVLLYRHLCVTCSKWMERGDVVSLAKCTRLWKGARDMRFECWACAKPEYLAAVDDFKATLRAKRAAEGAA